MVRGGRYCGNSHAYMSFRALAQTDEDFDKWVKRFQNAQNPNLATKFYDPKSSYDKGDLVNFVDPKLGAGANREYRSVRSTLPGQSPQLNPGAWEKHIPMITRLANNFFIHALRYNVMP